MSSTSDQADPAQSVDEALAAELRLCMVSGVGPRIRKALLKRFEGAANVFRAAPSELRDVEGVGPKLVRSITAAEQEIDVAKEIAFCREKQITLLLETSAAYPRPLKDIHDPPGVLFVRGEILPVDALAVAIVGTRHATAYGLVQAERLASGLAHAGYTIISGLARGIDSAAHTAALKVGGRTIAVLGGGVLEIYPPENEPLAQQVMDHGAILSESHPLAPPLAGSFPQRNRIISGMSLGVIVVEASDRSGALITARLAMEQGREVFAVPGRVDSRNSRGCHRLIRDGAKLTETVDDVLEEFGPLVAAAPREDGREIRHPVELQLNELETSVLTAIGSDPTSIDEVISSTKMAVPQVLSTISVLEMKRLIRRVSGNKVIRL